MRLGVDIGSVSLKLALVDEGGRLRFAHYARTEGRPVEVLLSGLSRLQRECRVERFSGVAATGSGKHLLARLEGVGTTNEIMAHARAVERLCPGVRTVIEIGGQDSKLIQLDSAGRLIDHAFNDLCAAGTGAFLDQQAARMGMTVAELGRLAARNRSAVPVASRCAVFAKSDMIHHQQEGVKPGKVARGLCLALARNYLANMLRGRKPKLPIAFCGGVAKSAGVRSAFIELLGLGQDDWVLPEQHHVMGAIGAALVSDDLPELDLAYLRSLADEPMPKSRRLPRLSVGDDRSADVESGDPREGVILGLDLGSVSAKGVATDRRGRVVASHYTLTEGRPLEALGRVLKSLRRELNGDVPVLACGVTGSGRMIAASACGADLVRDEITAQLAASQALDPEVDTVFEIGGQDSKVLVIRDGQLADFALNRICAAGTGSFLAEQAARLNIQVEEEFGSRALQSPAPVELGSRCTVFMDSDLIHHQQQGCQTDDLLGGLAYSVVENFLEHVIEGRPVGRRIWFQGGVAANPAVRAAFEQILKRPVNVHPHHLVTGALGAALLAGRELAAGMEDSSFVGFDNYSGRATNRHFTCKHCANHCEVVQVKLGEQPALSFGGGCDRYELQGQKEDIQHRTRFMTAVREELEGVFERQAPYLPRKIGLPRALWTMTLAPFWVGFFNSLGIMVVPSRRSNRALYRAGQVGVISEHCFGIKLALAHVYDLLQQPVEWIFLPSYAGVPRPTEDMQREYNSMCCPYVQTLPDIARAGFPTARLLSPRIDLSLGPNERTLKKLVRDLGPTLGVTRGQLAGALAQGFAAWNQHRSRMREIGERALQETGDERVVVLAGHAYQLHDPLLSFSLPVRAATCGATVIPMDVLPLEEISLGEEWMRVYWRSNRDLMRFDRWLEDHPRLLPVLLTSFACGPDAFTSRYLQENRKGKSLLVLELDEHTAEAGLMTRLQAYLANLPPAGSYSKGKRFHPIPYSMKDFDGRALYIPNWAQHSAAFKAAFQRDGVECHVFPPTSLEALKLGRAWSSGHECNPFAYILGDILALAQTPGFDPSRAAVFMPTTHGPCLLSQFSAGFELALRGLGIEGLFIDDAARKAIRARLRISTLLRLLQGFVAVEVLSQLVCNCRPFEKTPGAVEEVGRRNIADLEAAILGGDIPASVTRSRNRMQEVTGPIDPERPQIAVVGDIFTRLAPVANGNLYRRIEALGCTVKVPPLFIDTNWHDLPTMIVDNIQRREPREVARNIAAGVFGAISTRMIQPPGCFGEGAGIRLWEWSWWNVEQLLKGHLNHNVCSTMAMNVALARDAVASGADGVINAICHNCMIGMVSDTVFKRLSEEPGAPAYVTLAFDGLQETNTNTRLEAVCERAHQRRRARLARGTQAT